MIILPKCTVIYFISKGDEPFGEKNASLPPLPAVNEFQGVRGCEQMKP